MNSLLPVHRHRIKGWCKGDCGREFLQVVLQNLSEKLYELAFEGLELMGKTYTRTNSSAASVEVVVV